MTPSGESPLLLPANEHKQLVVIDFEYSNANVPGLEFANHFVSTSQSILLNRASMESGR
jgi:thiamine kinase-like enzyme